MLTRHSIKHDVVQAFQCIDVRVKLSVTAATTTLYLGYINFIGLSRTSIERNISFSNNMLRKKMNLKMMKKGCCAKYLRKSCIDY